MVNILVAPAAYKGSIPASRLAHAMAEATRRFFCDFGKGQNLTVLEAPIADGGDDTVLCLHEAIGGELVYRQVIGPTGQAHEAPYLRLDDMAIVELAAPSGIAHLTTGQLAPLAAHTYGLGQLIGDAIAGGARKVVVTLGGSASTDGGTGALAALGAGFLNRHGEPIALGGGGLSELVSIDLSNFVPARSDVQFVIATDVVSPLLGPGGASHVFAPQKGADRLQVDLLERNLGHFAAVVEGQLPATGKEPLCNIEDEGAGAAGGAGFGLASLLPAQIVSGFHFFAQLLDLPERIEQCDLIIVAEGCLDGQSLVGKGVGEIIAMARGYSKDILAVPALCALDEPTLKSLAAAGKETSRFIVAQSAALSPLSIATLDEVERATAIGLARWLDL